MIPALETLYGADLVVRAPVPVTVNKAGANYKSEIAHTSYAPRDAYDEWLGICDAIVACGGDAILEFEEEDERFLDRGALEVDRHGSIRPAGGGEALGALDSILTGRVFTANGPWTVVRKGALRAAMPHMLPHRQAEAPYYERLLARVAEEAGLHFEPIPTPDRWEGMADVAAVGDRVVLTYAVPGHYDEGLSPKSKRSSREGVARAADVADIPEEARVYAELVYPHFHGDTVHFGARPASGEPVLVHYADGLWRGESARLRAELGEDRIVSVSREDAVENYATNSRQVRGGVLIPEHASGEFEASMTRLGLDCHRLRLYELFGKAGGGPACATLFLPSDLAIPARSRYRYSVVRDEAIARRERIPERVDVDPAYFENKPRG